MELMCLPGTYLTYLRYLMYLVRTANCLAWYLTLGYLTYGTRMRSDGGLTSVVRVPVSASENLVP